MPGANADLAPPPPALVALLEKIDLAVESYAQRRRFSFALVFLSSGKGHRGRSPRKTRNTLWSTAISGSSACFTP